MASNRCPSCASDFIRALGRLTPDETAEYHRCDDCGHMWATFTDGRAIHHAAPQMTHIEAARRRVTDAIALAKAAIRKTS